MVFCNKQYIVQSANLKGNWLFVFRPANLRKSVIFFHSFHITVIYVYSIEDKTKSRPLQIGLNFKFPEICCKFFHKILNQDNQIVRYIPIVSTKKRGYFCWICGADTNSQIGNLTRLFLLKIQLKVLGVLLCEFKELSLSLLLLPDIPNIHKHFGDSLNDFQKLPFPNDFCLKVFQFRVIEHKNSPIVLYQDAFSSFSTSVMIEWLNYLIF